MNPSPADLLLVPPLGRQLLAGYVGWGPDRLVEDALFEQGLGLGPVPGRSRLQLGRRADAALAGRAGRAWPAR